MRNGFRGMFWLESLVEVATPGGRIAFSPIAPADAESLVVAAAGGTLRPRALGPTAEIPRRERQARLTFARVGVIDPLDVADDAAHGELASLRRALETAPADIVQEVTRRHARAAAASTRATAARSPTG